MSAVRRTNFGKVTQSGARRNRRRRAVFFAASENNSLEVLKRLMTTNNHDGKAPRVSLKKARPTRAVSLEELRADLRARGVEQGRHLIVHSSLSAIGRVEDGPAGFLRALREVLGSEAVLAMPSFNMFEERWSCLETPGNTGLLTETLRRLPGTIRSLHPTHSVSLNGPGAAEFAAGHEKARGGLDVGTPLHKLARAGADVLMVGVNFRRCSLVHVSESILELDYQDIAYPGYDRSGVLVDAAGREIPYAAAQFPGDSEGFDIVERELRRREKLKEGKIGEAVSFLARGTDILDACLDLLRGDPAALLCEKKTCPVCPARRRKVASPAS